MKKLFLLLPIIAVGFYFFTGQSQEDKPEKWSRDQRTTELQDLSKVMSSPLPMEHDHFIPNNQPMYYNSPNGVTVVNPNIRVLPRQSPFSYQTEVILTRHPGNPLIMYGSSNAISNAGGSLFISEGAYVTTNGGTTWFGSDTMKNTVGTILTGHGGDPGITIDKDGRFIISHLGGGIKANYSTNNGLNWSNDVTITSGSQDKNLTTTDDSPTSPYYGRSYTAWSRFTASLPPIAFSYTTNGGVSWSASADVNVPPAGHYSQGVDLRTGPNGEVYLCWAAPIASSPFTEDYCGFAKSTNGGVNWTVNNNIFDMNGIRGTLFSTSIRVNSFPRIDVDRTCGPRAGWIYIVVSQRNLAPAGSDADIVIHRSTDGGTSWSAGIRVNQDALNNGKSQWFPAVRVDESGGVNVVYYDNRGTTNTDTNEVYMSRSMDGGTTWTDIKVSDARFRPTSLALSGVAGGYQGDYIGITSALIEGNPVNGNQRIWPFWADNRLGGFQYQAYTAKVELLPKNPCTGCEDFASAAFTPKYFHLEYSGTQFWSRQNPSAYGAGTGSVKYDFFSDNVRTPQSLITDFQTVPAGYYLTFDQAYAPYGPGFPGPDTLLVESSTNGGSSYTTLAVLLGRFPSGGELNTAPATTNAFVPTSSQWAPKIYSLPVGTNRVRLRAESGFGNNLYVDNICVQALAAPVSNSLCDAPEGFFRTSPPSVVQDTITVYLKRTDFPNITVDSAKMYMFNYGCQNFTFNNALNGSYHMVFKHRNSIETWTNAGIPNYTRGLNFAYDLINNNAIVYGGNQTQVPNFSFWFNYSGDCNRDGVIDISDLTIIDNDAFSFVSGYVQSDVNGDNFSDLSDYALADNNAFNVVTRIIPPGAVPEPQIVNNDAPVFSTEAEKTKYEMHLKIMKEKGVSENDQQINVIELNEVLKQRQERMQNNKAPVRKSFDIQSDGNVKSGSKGVSQ
ncbi:MAG TPA: hypothetical protein PK536_11950 [Ignavibacteria bacterium]|nr:hypothetical protein [Bacteroidota bacterium]HRI86147.1 hypothetical protein [Ignavibacteria bacterium]HRK00361.1 hypothetical protein [Ignavibacteria bacterium]